jgi:hypothetical protein
MITSSAAPGTTPPTQVVVADQSAPPVATPALETVPGLVPVLEIVVATKTGVYINPITKNDKKSKLSLFIRTPL